MNRETLLAKGKVYRESNVEVVRARCKRWRDANRARIAELNRLHYAANRDVEIARATAWSKANGERVRANRKLWFKARYDSDPRFKMANRLRSRLTELLRKNGKSSSKTLRLDGAALVEHIERHFLPGMTWKNHGKVWHVDHVVPCAEFDLTKPFQIRACFALSNLRPLWARENIQKSAKLMRQTEFNLI